MSPIPVQIVNAAAWWIPWLPFIGSLLVAGAAYRGVVLSNRANRAAIEASDRREHERWRRDELLDLMSEFMTLVYDLQSTTSRTIRDPVENSDEASDQLDYRRSKLTQLYVVNNGIVLLAGTELREAAQRTVDTMRELHRIAIRIQVGYFDFADTIIEHIDTEESDLLTIPSPEDVEAALTEAAVVTADLVVKAKSELGELLPAPQPMKPRWWQRKTDEDQNDD